MKITLKVKTPLLIWDGINRTTFEVLEEEDGAKIYDIYRVISTLPYGRLKEMEDLLKQLIRSPKGADDHNLNARINDFWKNVKNKASCSIIYKDVSMESKDFRSKGNLIVQAHTGFPGAEMPYIPGSSVKGAMLTGIMVQAAISSSGNPKTLKPNLDKIYDKINKAQLRVMYQNHQVTYSYALGRAFRFSDFMPEGEWKLSIMNIERKKDANGKGGIPNVGVFLTSGTFKGEFDYDRDEMETFLDIYKKSEDANGQSFPSEDFFRKISDTDDAYEKMIEGIKYIDQKLAKIPADEDGNTIITLGRYRGAGAMAISDFLEKQAKTMWYTQKGERPGLIIAKR